MLNFLDHKLNALKDELRQKAREEVIEGLVSEGEYHIDNVGTLRLEGNHIDFYADKQLLIDVKVKRRWGAYEK